MKKEQTFQAVDKSPITRLGPDLVGRSLGSKQEGESSATKPSATPLDYRRRLAELAAQDAELNEMAGQFAPATNASRKYSIGPSSSKASKAMALLPMNTRNSIVSALGTKCCVKNERH